MKIEVAYNIRTILLSALVLCTLLSNAQNAKLVKGIVVTGNGDRLASCKVMIKGTETTVTSNACGEFGIETNKNLFTLVFTSSTQGGGVFEVPFSEHDLKRNDSIVFKLASHAAVPNSNCNTPLNLRLRQVRVR